MPSAAERAKYREVQIRLLHRQAQVLKADIQDPEFWKEVAAVWGGPPPPDIKALVESWAEVRAESLAMRAQRMKRGNVRRALSAPRMGT